MDREPMTGELALMVRVLSARTATLKLRGRLNARTARALRARVDEVIGQGRPEILCDLTEVTALDSSGLAGLIAAVKATTWRDGFFKFAGANEEVQRMFKLTGLDRVFELHRGVETVLAGSATSQANLRAA